MTSPLGFITRGKKIRIGEVPRNKAQVYPIVISGKIAYIRAQDLHKLDEKQQGNMMTDRFQRITHVQEDRTSLSVGYLTYTSQIKTNQVNDELADKDVITWQGISLRGDKELSPKWDLIMMANYMMAKQTSESFNMIETGVGAAVRVFDKNKFLVRLDGHFMAIPFANYSVQGDFRVNGYGYGFGGGINMTYRLDKNWGIDGYGGISYTQLVGFNVPAPYDSIAPSFFGNRLGLGVNYLF
jgi:hypothetical protein